MKCMGWNDIGGIDLTILNGYITFTYLHICMLRNNCVRCHHLYYTVLTFQLFTKDFVNFEQEVWLGASDIAEEGLWVNLDGTPFNRDLFMEGEPDNYANSENCLILTKKLIEVGSDKNEKEYISKYGIADTHCTTNAKASICEFERC